jgi:hypothetical protein
MAFHYFKLEGVYFLTRDIHLLKYKLKILRCKANNFYGCNSNFIRSFLQGKLGITETIIIGMVSNIYLFYFCSTSNLARTQNIILVGLKIKDNKSLE